MVGTLWWKGTEVGGPRAPFILWESYLELLVATRLKVGSWFYCLVYKNALRMFACQGYWKRKQITPPIPVLAENSLIGSWRSCWGGCSRYRMLFLHPVVAALIPSASGSAFLCCFFFPFLFTEIQLTYNIMLVSGVLHDDLTFACIMEWSPR